jgi:hypothetical protein
MTIDALIANRLAAPKQFTVTTLYADGRTKRHDTETMGQAENWAGGERHKIGRELIDRTTGKTVTVRSVTISAIV